MSGARVCGAGEERWAWGLGCATQKHGGQTGRISRRLAQEGRGWKAGQRQGGVCTDLRRIRDSENGLGAEPVPRLGHGVGWARKWGGVLVKLKGKGTD